MSEPDAERRARLSSRSWRVVSRWRRMAWVKRVMSCVLPVNFDAVVFEPVVLASKAFDIELYRINAFGPQLFHVEVMGIS